MRFKQAAKNYFFQGRSLRFSGYQIAYVFTCSGKVFLVFHENLSIIKTLLAGFFYGLWGIREDILYFNLPTAAGNNKGDFKTDR